jgi:hypothetical protein
LIAAFENNKQTFTGLGGDSKHHSQYFQSPQISAAAEVLCAKVVTLYQ